MAQNQNDIIHDLAQVRLQVETSLGEASSLRVERDRLAATVAELQQSNGRLTQMLSVSGSVGELQRQVVELTSDRNNLRIDRDRVVLELANANGKIGELTEKCSNFDLKVHESVKAKVLKYGIRAEALSLPTGEQKVGDEGMQAGVSLTEQARQAKAEGKQ